MKIDIHTHTKKCKSGDAPTREVTPERFCEIILSTEVGIIAITNHNVFDLPQYLEIENRLNSEVQVWPGVELDILDDGLRGHLLVIVSPKQSRLLAENVERLTKGQTPDTFVISIEEVLTNFDSMKPLYVAHYKQKKPELSEAAIEKLVSGTATPTNVIKEVTNSISAGIYISHGHPSIYGSDVHDWSKYEANSHELPDIRLPVESFEHFCLLLRKDPTTINTLLDRKISQDLVLTLFEGSSILKLKTFNDIHVIFGPKGTGKSCILEAIAQYYRDNGSDIEVYTPGSDRLHSICDTAGEELTVALDEYGIEDCTSEINVLREAVEVDVTGVAKFLLHFKAKATNKNAKKILLKDLEPEEEGGLQRHFGDSVKAVVEIRKFLAFLSGNRAIQDEFSAPEREQLTSLLSEWHDRMVRRRWAAYCRWKEVCLLNSAIKLFRYEIERKTGTPAKPTTTGFRGYAANRIKIEKAAGAIVKSIETSIPIRSEFVGHLGPNKGDLELRTELKFQTAYITDGSFSPLGAAKKSTQKNFALAVRKVLAAICHETLFQEIASLNDIDDVDDVESASDLLMFKRYFALAGIAYSPSSGEGSMVMLQRELSKDKEIYILDEPERSLGNEYISEVIVPLIKARARAGRRIFIATHDANIAVRTLPYSSIYRCHGESGYRTYIGNPFSNHLSNPDDPSEQLDWKIVSMKTLEGGEDAFGERGNIYGNR